MRCFLLLLLLASSVTNAATFLGQESDGYWYPDFQAWRIIEARRLAPANVQQDLLGIPTIMVGSLLYFSDNYFTFKSPNSGGDLIFPACFIQDETGMQAHVVDDKAQSYLGEYVNFGAGKKGMVYLTWGGMFLFGIKQESLFDASLRPKFEDAVTELQDPLGKVTELANYLQDTAYRPNPEARARAAKVLFASLLMKGECAYIAPKKSANTAAIQDYKITFPQLNKHMVVAGGLVDVGKNMKANGGVARQKLPRSVEYIKKDGCVSDILFSDYTNAVATNKDAESEYFITRGFMGRTAANTIMRSERWKQWFMTDYQLRRLLGLKLEDIGMKDVLSDAMRSSCHRELYRKRIDFRQILTQFQGFQGFTYYQEKFYSKSTVWQTDDLLVLETKEYKLNIYDKSEGELVVTMEYPLDKTIVEK